MTYSIKIRKERSKTYKRKMECLLKILSVNLYEIINTINWTTTILPGIFTLIGSALGAFLAGKYAVRAVTNQMKYDKNNKRIDILDSNLKISNEFTTRLHLLLKEIKEYENTFLSNEENKIYTNQDNSIESITELKSYTVKTYSYLSNLPINNMPFEDYTKYEKTLRDLEGLKAVLSISQYEKLILKRKQKRKRLSEEEIKEFKNRINDIDIQFDKYKNEIEKAQKEIETNYLNSHSEYRKIKKEINKLTKNKFI